MVVQKDKHQISAKEKKYGFEASTSTPKEQKFKKDKSKLEKEKRDREDRAGVALFGDQGDRRLRRVRGGAQHGRPAGGLWHDILNKIIGGTLSK